MATAILEKAIDSLRTLPPEMQEEIGSTLLEYMTKWQDLRAGIARGGDELAKGRGIEITDVEAFVDRVMEPDGRA